LYNIVFNVMMIKTINGESDEKIIAS
jgi:hypothetical protein